MRVIEVLKNYISIPVVLYALLLLVNSTGILPIVPSYIQAGIFALFIIIMLFKRPRIEPKSRNLWLWIPITILLANPNPIFRSWERFIMFSSAFFVLSPFMQGEWHRQMRRKLLYSTLTICTLVGVASFVCYFLGINLFVRQELLLDDYLEYAGHFSGIARHSMILGPMAGLGSSFCLYLFFVNKKRYWLIPGICCIAAMLFSASRTCFICTIASTLVIFYKYAGSKRRFIKILTLVTVLAAISFPIWGGALWGIQAKQAGHKNSGDMFDSRTEKVVYRTHEFVASPVWGQGFSSINTQYGDAYDVSSGTIEPGSSWLFVLSSTGIIGFLLFLSLYKHSLVTSFHRVSDISILLSAIVLFIGLHLITEGYLFATSNIMSIIAWLIIGCGCDMAYECNMNKSNYEASYLPE